MYMEILYLTFSKIGLMWTLYISPYKDNGLADGMQKF